jgi:hypothetical protein
MQSKKNAAEDEKMGGSARNGNFLGFGEDVKGGRDLAWLLKFWRMREA